MASTPTKKTNTRRTRAARGQKPPARPHKVATSARRTSDEELVSRPVRPKFPNSWQILLTTLRFWGRHGQVLAIYVLVLAGLSLLLVHNFGADVSALKSQVSQYVGTSAPVGSLATFALYLGNSGSSAQGAAGVYQYLLLIIASLSMIWLLRQLLSDNPPATLRVRDAFYQGMYPLIPFVLVLLVLSLELLPLIIGSFFYTTVVQNGIAVGAVQDIAWLLVLVVGAVISLWLLATSFFAIYIVTLPNMTPVLALRNARQLSRGQRANIIRKSIVLMVLLLLVSAVLLLPVIAVLPRLAGVVLFSIGVIAVPFVHSYFYTLYRELLQ